MTKKKSRLSTRKKLLFCSIVTLVALIGVEIAVRRFGPPPTLRPLPDDQPPGLYVAHPERHFTYAPGWQGRIEADEYRIQVAINSLGMRDDELAPGERVDVLAAGCSFTYGFGVESDESWPEQLEARLNESLRPDRPLQVLNAGVSAYGLQQIRSRVEEGLALRPAVVALGVYPAAYWRLDDPYVFSQGYVMRQETVGNKFVIDDNIMYTEFKRPLLQDVHFWMLRYYKTGALIMDITRRRLAEDEDDDDDGEPASAGERLRPLLAELQAIAELCRANDAELFVLLINRQQWNGGFEAIEYEYNELIKDYCLQNDIAVHDPIPTFTRTSRRPVFRIGRDSHWSRTAHAVAGRDLAAAMLRDRPTRRRLAAALQSP